MATSFRSADGGCGFQRGEEVCRRSNGQIHIGLDGRDAERALALFALLPSNYRLLPEGSNIVITVEDLRRSCRDFGKKNPEQLPIACGTNYTPGNGTFGRIFPTDPYDIAEWWAVNFIRKTFGCDYPYSSFERMTGGTTVRRYRFIFKDSDDNQGHEVIVVLNYITHWGLRRIDHQGRGMKLTCWCSNESFAAPEFRRVASHL